MISLLIGLFLGGICLWQESLLRKKDLELEILRKERTRDMEALYGRLADLRRWNRKT